MTVAKNFSSTIGYRADTETPENIYYTPHVHPLLLVADQYEKQSPIILDKVTEDALISQWNVKDYTPKPLYTSTRPHEHGGYYEHIDTQKVNLLESLAEYRENIKAQVIRMLDNPGHAEPFREILIVENIHQYPRRDKKAILENACQILLFAGLLEIGIVISSLTPQTAVIKNFRVEYLDLRFDRNSYESAYKLTDDERYAFNQLKNPERFAYIRSSRSQKNMMLLPSMSRSRVATEVQASDDIKGTLERILKKFMP